MSEANGQEPPAQVPENIIAGVVVYAVTSEKGRLMLRRVPVEGHQNARKVLTFIKHRIQGGRLKMSAQAVPLPVPEAPAPASVEEKNTLIIIGHPQ